MDDDTSRGGAAAKSTPDDLARAPETSPERDLPGALHEVSNALTVVLGWIDNAREMSGEGSEAARALEIAAARARQARQIVRRAIGARVPEEPPARLAKVVTDAVVGLEPEARRAGLSLSMHVDPKASPLIVEGASAIVQILTNLLLNAIAVSPHGGTIGVDVHLRRVGAVVIGVSDEGPGIAANRRAALLEAGITTRAGGAGIGLRHAAALARDAGGALVLADAPAGARFELTWPYKRADAPAAAPSSGAGTLAGKRVLVVEDDDAVVELLDTALSARGAIVVAVKRRRELDAALLSGAFDAALVDVSPIKEDIAGALAAVRQANRGARLIVISGSSASLPDLAPDSAPQWIRKPFEIGEIVRAVAGG